MQDCFRLHPDVYGEELADDVEAQEATAARNEHRPEALGRWRGGWRSGGGQEVGSHLISLGLCVWDSGSDGLGKVDRVCVLCCVWELSRENRSGCKTRMLTET